MTEAPPTEQAVVVVLGACRYAIPMAAVAEVGRLPRLTRVPGAAPWLIGIANWRGRILAVADIRALLGAVTRTPDLSGRLVIVTYDGVSLGVVTERVEGITTLPPDADPPLPTVTTTAAQLLRGQFTDAAGPIALIDPAALIRLRDETARRSA